MKDQICKRIIFTGNVQGVGFRYQTYKISEKHNITGYVRNLDDGSVELIVQGDLQSFQNFIQSVSETLKEYISDYKEEDHKKISYPNFFIQKSNL